MTVKGTSKADKLEGTRAADVIAGLGGADTIEGRGGDDLVCGGPGNDRLRGGTGSDTLDGDAGNDSANGGRGSNPCPRVERILACIPQQETSGPGCQLLQRGQGAPNESRLNEGANDPALSLRPTGTLRAVMLFADFANAPADDDPAALFAGLGPPAKQWFAEVSYGRLDLEITPVLQYVRMPQLSTSYDRRLNQRRYVFDATAAADALVDFKQYDIVYVVPSAAAGRAYGASYAFSRLAGAGVVRDGREIRHAASFGSTVRAPGFTSLVHETGHLIGLPDLYLTDQSLGIDRRSNAGVWDAMSSSRIGAPFLAWHRKKLGWLDPGQVRCMRSGAIIETITPLATPGGVKAIAALTSSSKAYVFEARKRIGQDQRLCSEGVLTYIVDSLAVSGTNPIRVKPAAAVPERCGVLSAAPFREGQSYLDRSTGVRMQVLARRGTEYEVMVVRTP